MGMTRLGHCNIAYFNLSLYNQTPISNGWSSGMRKRNKKNKKKPQLSAVLKLLLKVEGA